MMIKKISKKLSANDIGSTGSHQAGILVPKDPSVLGFFPILDRSLKNPRMTLIVREMNDGTRWKFNFIYYNNKLFGGTRNEYRLTCMTKYLRSVNAKIDDDLVFQMDKNNSIFVDCKRNKTGITEVNEENVLVISGGWKVIKI